MKRSPRPVIRFARGIIRYPRRLFPRSKPLRIRRYEQIPFFYKLKKQPKEEYPELYEELQKLKEKFEKKGRKLDVYCMDESQHKYVSLETCMCRCKSKCYNLEADKLKGPKDTLSEFMDDYIKLQRLVYMIYGTVRTKDAKIRK